MQLNEKSSFVLVTNYHVIGSEEIAAQCILHFEGMDIQLSLEKLLVKTTFMNSDINKVSDLDMLVLYQNDLNKCKYGEVLLHNMNSLYTSNHVSVVC